MQEIKFTDHKKTKRKKRIFSMIFINVFAIIFVTIVEMSNTRIEYEEDSTNGLVFLLGLYGCLIVHELLLGLFFKVFLQRSEVYFSMKRGLLYVDASGGVMSYRGYVVSSILPFLVIVTSLVLFLYIGLLPKLTFLIISMFYVILRAKYFYWIYEVMRQPKNSKIRIMEIGFQIVK